MQCIMSIDAIKRNILFLSAIAIVLIGIFSYNSYHERNVRKYSEKFLEYSFKYCIISSIIGERECAVCNRCVMNKLYFNTKTGETYSEDECTRSMVNDLIYCSSKNEMLNQQAFFYTGMGVMDLLEDYREKMDDAFRLDWGVSFQEFGRVCFYMAHMCVNRKISILQMPEEMVVTVVALAQLETVGEVVKELVLEIQMILFMEELVDQEVELVILTTMVV